MVLMIATLALAACADEVVCSDTAEIGGRCDNTTSSLCHHNTGWCTEDLVCRSHCSIVQPFCNDGETPTTSHSYSGLSWTCVCVPNE